MSLVGRARPRRPVNSLGGDSDSQGGFVAVLERDVVEARSITRIRLWDSVPAFVEREPKKNRR